MDPTEAMDKYQEQRCKDMYETSKANIEYSPGMPWADFWALRKQKTKLIITQMIGVAISLVLQLICGLNQLLPREVLWWWILPLGIWCLVFFILIARVQNKIDTLMIQLREQIRSRRNELES